MDFLIAHLSDPHLAPLPRPAMRDLASLLLIGIALAPAFKMRFWNTGAEGQVLMGALATAAVMVYYGGKVPNALLYTAMLVASVQVPSYFQSASCGSRK